MSVETSSHCEFERKTVRKPTLLAGIILGVLAAICPSTLAADAAAGAAEAGSLEDALFGGKIDFNLRARVEIADQDTKNTSQALTERIRARVRVQVLQWRVVLYGL